MEYYIRGFQSIGFHHLSGCFQTAAQVHFPVAAIPVYPATGFTALTIAEKGANRMRRIIQSMGDILLGLFFGGSPKGPAQSQRPFR